VPLTPNWSLPYQTLLSQPHGPDLGEQGFLAVDAALTTLNASIAALAATVSVLDAPWVPYTPTWVSLTGTNPTVANHSLVGSRYKRLGLHLAVAEVLVTFGGAGYGTGVYAWGLPFAATAASAASSGGSAHFLDFTQAEYDGGCALANTTQVRAFYTNASVTNIFPFTFGNTDTIKLSIMFEPA
jgi:hypothetical protein